MGKRIALVDGHGAQDIVAGVRDDEVALHEAADDAEEPSPPGFLLKCRPGHGGVRAHAVELEQ
eukprot:7510570-Alexandrium_andersonii.AAC.1